MAQWYYYYGGLADKIEGAVIPTDKPDTFNYTNCEPLGVVRGDRAVELPAAAAHVEAGARARRRQHDGDQAVGVHVGSALEFVKLVEDAGFPPGVVNVVTGFGADTGAPLVEHPLVAKVAFTGSDAHRPARSSRPPPRGMKQVSMELGGKSPNIVFDDADLDNAVKGVGVGHLRGHRADLHRRLAAARAAQHPRPVPRETAGLREDARAWATP